MIYINPEIQIPNLDESRIFKFIKHDQTFRWIRGQKSGHVRASQKGDHCCAESLELVLHAVGSLKDVALQTEKMPGWTWQWRGEAARDAFKIFQESRPYHSYLMHGAFCVKNLLMYCYLLICIDNRYLQLGSSV